MDYAEGTVSTCGLHLTELLTAHGYKLLSYPSFLFLPSTLFPSILLPFLSLPLLLFAFSFVCYLPRKLAQTWVFPSPFPIKARRQDLPQTFFQVGRGLSAARRLVAKGIASLSGTKCMRGLRERYANTSLQGNEGNIRDHRATLTSSRVHTYKI